MPVVVGNVKRSRCAVLFTLCLLVTICIFTFAGYMSLEYLQSSINPDHGLGITTMSINYACKSVSSLLGPFIIIRLTPKWTMVVAFITQLIYIAANVYPHWYTMYPAAFVMGLAMGPLWIAIGVYITTLAVYYSHITAQPKSAVMSKFNGINALSMPLAIICGNIISALVFKYVVFQDQDIGNGVQAYNETTTIDCLETNMTDCTFHAKTPWEPRLFIPRDKSDLGFTENFTEDWDVSYCNVNYCPRMEIPISNTTSDAESDPQKPDMRNVYVLLIILAGLNVTGILMTVLFLKNLPRRDIESTCININKSLCDQVADYFKELFNWKYLLLTPCVYYQYLFFAIINSTFMKGYVTCTFGIHMVGISALILGVTAGLFSYISGWMGQCVHRNFQFLTAYILLLVTLGLMLLWDLFPWFWSYMSLLIVSVLSGMSMGIFTCQFPAFLGDVFTSTKTEAFSFYTFCSGLAMAAGYVATNYLCAAHQIYLLLGVMAVSFVTYTILSIHLYKTTRSSQQMPLPDIVLQENGPMISQHRSKSLAELTAEEPITREGRDFSRPISIEDLNEPIMRDNGDLNEPITRGDTIEDVNRAKNSDPLLRTRRTPPVSIRNIRNVKRDSALESSL